MRWDGKVRAEAIVGIDDAIGGFVGFLVVLSRSPHKTKIHKEFTSACRESGGRACRGLFPDVCLFFKIDETEEMVIEARGSTGDVARDDI